MRENRKLRKIIAGLVLIVTLAFVHQSNLAMDGQTCFVSTAVHQFCIFYEYGGYSSARDITISPDFSMLAATSPETNTSIFSSTDGRVIRELPESSAYSLAFSPNSRKLAIGSEDVIKIWDAPSRLITETLTGVDGGVFSLSFSPDGKYLAAGGEGTIYLWSMPSGEMLDFAEDNDLQFVDGIGEITFAPDSHSLVSMSIEGGKVWSILNDGKLVFTRTLNSLADTSDFSPNGETLAISGVGMNIELYNTNSYTLSKVIPFRSTPQSNRGTSSLKFTVDGDALIVGELGIEDFTAGLQVIDIETSETILNIDGSGSEVYAIETAFNGEYVVGLASGRTDYIIYWRLQ